MPVYIGSSRYKVYVVDGGTSGGSSGSGSTTIDNSEQAVADLIEGNATEVSNSKVTGIRQGFFQSCTSLTTVSFPECTTIGSYAFQACTSLTSVAFSKCMTMGDSAFQSCTSLTTANFSNCTELPSYAFENCTSLTSISFPECTTIGEKAFSACESLLTADFPNCTTIGKAAFKCADMTLDVNPKMALQEISFPKCISIGESAFYSCQITSVYFPECTTVEASAFQSCRGISTIDLPKCTKIGYSAFDGCWHLASVSLPVCSRLEYNAFRACMFGLTTISLPNCTFVGGRCFYQCESLSQVNLPNCTSIGDSCFGMCESLSQVNLPNCTSIGKNIFYKCSALSAVDLPSLGIVPSSAFSGTTSLKSINLPNCTSVGNSAFYSCTSLKSINLPNCTSVGSSAFQYCSSLSAVTFNSLTYIGSRAFSSCSSLTNFTNRYSSVATLYHNSVFYGTPMSVSTYTGSYGSIYVPMSLVSSYKAATNWAYYADRIAPLDGIGQIEDITMGQGLTKSITAPLYRFDSAPESISVTPNSENITISNIQATSDSITFDVSSNDIIGSVECNIEAMYNETQYAMTFEVNVVKSINIESISNSIGFTKTKSVTLLYYGDSTAELSVTSSDDSKLSVSNAQLTENTITFDITSSSVESEVVITVSATYGGNTYAETATVTISNALLYNVTNLEDSTYGFVLNDRGYYESNNKGVSSSHAICKVNIDVPVDCVMYVDCINYAEDNYDYGILSNLDSVLTLSSSADSSYKKSFKGSSSAIVQTVSYDVTAGEHFIYIKYIKDSSQDKNNDSLQFIIRLIKNQIYSNIISMSLDGNGDVYNDGLGYCDYMALDDTGEEFAKEGYCVTGYFEGNKGSIFRFKNYGLGDEDCNCLALYDEDLSFLYHISFASETNLDGRGVSFSDGVLTFDSSAVTSDDLPETFNIRLSTKASGENLIATYNEDID